MIVLTLARKPPTDVISRGIMAHGTGGLNINACRISGGGPSGLKPFIRGTTSPMGGPGGINSIAVAGRPVTFTDHPGGRWPANVVFEHRPACVMKGPRRDNVPVFEASRSKRFTDRKPGVKIRSTGEARNMDISLWDCDHDCPVLALDDERGVGKSPAPYAHKTNVKDRFFGAVKPVGYVSPHYGDEGTVSRFFKQFGGTR